MSSFPNKYNHLKYITVTGAAFIAISYFAISFLWHVTLATHSDHYGIWPIVVLGPLITGILSLVISVLSFRYRIFDFILAGFIIVITIFSLMIGYLTADVSSIRSIIQLSSGTLSSDQTFELLTENSPVLLLNIGIIGIIIFTCHVTRMKLLWKR